MYLKAFFQKTTLWFLAIFALALGVFVYATIDKTVVVTEQLIVVPDTVISDAWKSLDNTLISDISGDSLFQDFSKNNSSYLDLSDESASENNSPAAPDSGNITNDNEVEDSTVVVDDSASTSVDDTDADTPNEVENTTSEVEPDPAPAEVPVPPVQVETEEEPTPEEPAPEETKPTESTEPSPAEVSFFRNGSFYWDSIKVSTKAFPLAQEIITTEIQTVEEAPSTILPIEENTPDEVIEPPVQFEEEVIETGVVSEESDVSPEPELSPEELLVETTEAVEETESDLNIEEEVIEEVAVDSVVEEIIEVPKVENPCRVELGCRSYSAYFTGFSMPEFEPGTFLSSAQLRLSLAAKTKDANNRGLQRFVIDYKYAEEEVWQTATIIDIEDEASNSINGGYYLVSLEQPTNQGQLSNLQVRISYEGNVEYLDNAYIESLWLEVTSAEFFEDVATVNKDDIDYERDLMAPKFHSVNDSDLDPDINILPSFTMSYSPQQGFLKRLATAVFSENEYSVSKVRLIDASGAVVNVPINVIYQDDKTWTLKFLKQPQKLLPGKYQLEVTVNENETLFVDTFEFYWGVLAINTTKSMYFPGEEVDLNLAALTEDGNTICEANLELRIFDPSNNIYEIPVEQSGSCGKNNVTDIPDYLANFDVTNEVGLYKIQLRHLNSGGEVVHKVDDSFEVRDYIPYDIERKAPTRIYPPAPYDVELKIKAYRTFVGDIKEIVPRGFVLSDFGEAEVVTGPDYTELIWRNVEMQEGDNLTLSYRFDAPDISPYMYLLGPLDMDGFKELRQWQIASDALGAVAFLTGTQLAGGAEINTSAPDAVVWSTSTLDSYYFSHSTSTDPQKLNFAQDGDYFISLTVPVNRLSTDTNRARWGTEIRLNGVAVDTGLSRTGYIRGNSGSGHMESSNHSGILLTGITAGDYLTVYSELLTTYDAGISAEIAGQASLYVEYISPTADVFAAKSTFAIASTSATTTDLNQTFPNTLSWIETRQDTGFVHSDTVNPQNIVISNPGTYMVQIGVPLTSGDTAQRPNVLGKVLLDGVQVSGGQFKQGYLRGSTQTGDGDSSLYWSGVVVATTTNQVLTITGQQESVAGIVNITSGFAGSIYVQKLPATDVIVLRGTQVVTNSNDWNPASPAAVQWVSRDHNDAAAYTHSTSTNSQNIVVNVAGDYFLTFNDAVDIGSANRQAPKVTIQVNGTPVTGAQTQTNYMRDATHNNASAGLSVLLPGLAASATITVVVEQEANTGTVNDTTDAVVMIWKKAELNLRPEMSMYDVPFDNVRFASTTPYFDFSASDPDGSSDIQYQFQISTSSSFTSSTTRTSGTDSGFSNVVTPADTSPFTETEKIRFQLQPADALSDLTTYYWRARARDVSGSNQYGDWSTTQSLTVNLNATTPNWYQSKAGQFENNTLIGAVSSGVDDSLQVDGTLSSEVLLVYGESTNPIPQYRLWNGVTWGPELAAVTVDGTINWLRTASAVSREEYVMTTLDSSGRVYAQVYTASTSSWGNKILISNGVDSTSRSGLAVGYESVSGDAIALACETGANPVYRIWNGTSWSATSTVVVSSALPCNFLDIASDPASDEMILVTRDTGTQYEALVWDGSGWTDTNVLGSGQTGQEDHAGIGLAYETSGEQAIVAVTNGANNNFIYSTWNGTEWSLNATQGLGNDFEFGSLATDPNSDKMALCYIDADSDVGVIEWDGGVWSSFQELDTAGNDVDGRPVECVYETESGRSGIILAAYSDTVGVRYQTNNGSWSGESSVTGVNDSFWIQVERAGDGQIVTASLDDVIDDVEAYEWNGTTWSSKTTIEGTPSSVIANPYEVLDLVAKRFVYTAGTAITPPIDFTFVSSQPTWGDLTFTTVEPFGTDVNIKVRYTSTTTCDSYIPNGVLSGNGTGFGVESVPIDLTGLSTSTYSQICLEASLTTQGAASSKLSSWSVSWLREPKLIQNAFRWYVNGSFLTPTDPWPVGVFDLSENETVDSSVAVNNSDTIRLRMSLQGSNVTLPQFSETFKVQYAEGFTCSPLLSWNDVGDPASTTALWRGYENAIVGTDWYDGDWGRRLKLTVSNTLVDDDVTDFPVYVNLADLPAGFFNNVQNDGDDIRITTSDGITERPYELVLIDTSSKIGELYFKTNLSSTTDSEFYLYYGNATASGYSTTATYGRDNTWNSNFEAVWHMNNSGTTVIDSTGSGYTGSKGVGVAAPTQVSSPRGFSQSCDGNDYIEFGDVLDVDTNSWTISTWYKPTAVGATNNNIIYNKENLYEASGGGNYFTYAWQPHWNWDGGTSFSTSVGTWYHSAVVYNKTNQIIYKNGTNVYSRAQTGNMGNNAEQLQFCARGNTTHSSFFTGEIDEMRMSNMARPAAWLKTEFNNQSNPTGFYTVSAEELVSDGRLLPGTILSASDVAETYEEENPTRENQNNLPIGDDAEWDFVLQNNNAAVNTNYCFRMVYEDGSLFNTYTNYPRLITNAPPQLPVLSAPFDNERAASTTPWFEFTADDELGDDVAYQIQVSTDVDFASTDLDRNSISNFAEFENLSQPAQKSTFTTGETIRFVPTSSLSDATTYWWRVRAQDPDGSGSYGNWSEPNSFTVTSATVITTWFQTTFDQFDTDGLLDAVANVGSNDIGLETGFSNATVTSTVIDYDDRDTGNAWGDFSFTNNVTSGSIRYYIEYRVSGETFALIPDVDLTGNSSGFTSSPVSLVSLDTTIYNEIRIRATLSGNSTLPRLQDWSVTWSETIDIPTHVSPFDNAKVSTTTPNLTFFTSDPEGDDLQYELQLSSSYNFTSSSTYLSGVDAGFLNTVNGGDTSPFNTDEVIRYTVQSPLTNGNTYWWRVRAKDPAGSDSWSSYSTPQSFTIDTAITTSVWYQTTGDQFATGNLSDIETTAGGAQITSTIREVLTVYGEGTGQAPQYTTWNGTSWGAPASAQSVGAQISWLELKASPTRPEYALGTLGTDLDVNFQIYDSANDTWGDVLEIQTNSTSTKMRTFNLAYESISGDLIALACNDADAVYSIWNGTSWSATSSISLTNTESCEFIQVASDPVSDEIIAVFAHEITNNNDFEAIVWNGSSWGNAIQLGDRDTAANEGMAVGYEESGGQAIVAVSNNPNTTLLYNVWNGSSWSGTTTHALGDRFEWATLKSDVGTDNMALCYIDNDNDIGVLLWNGSAWGTFNELEQTGNDSRGRAVDCEFETTGANDGNLIIAYSDNTTTNYQTYNGSYSGEFLLDTVTDTFENTLVRAGDGLIHLAAYDDAPNPDRIEHRRWDGTAWTTDVDRFTSNSSLNNALPYVGGISMAPQIYPNFTSGSIRSNPIDFADGTGPRWDLVSWNDTTPGASVVEYRVYYESSPGVFSLIPDGDLSGNSTGFTTSPIDISAVDRTVYPVLQLDAQLICDSGDCPTIENWSVSWSEGITVSGIAREYDGVSTTTSGTVAVAVNGIFQAGKTGTILGDGTWSISNVTAFPGETVMVFVDGAADADESISLATYNGVGNITGMELNKRHLTIGSDSTATTTNTGFDGYDNSDDEDIFISVDGSNNLNVCVEVVCADAKLKIKSGSAYVPGAAIITHDFSNFGTFAPATNTIRVSGSWNGQGTFIPDTSTVIFTATTSSETITATGTIYSFYNLTFGETSGSASWALSKPFDINGSLAIYYGTMARGTSTINIAGNLSVGTGGFIIGLATTTFDGTGSNTWSDAKSTASSSNAGYVVVDGTAKTITLAGNVGAQSVTIGSDDTLNASGSGYNINVVNGWLNNNAFIPQTGTVTFTGTSTNTIFRGASAFNNLTFSGAGSNWSFSSSTLALNGNLTIATGTVTLPTGTTTIAGSFTNSGGTFLHNNGEVRMTSSVGGKTLTQSGTAFLNAFYDLVFSGSGAWSFATGSATTSRHFRIQSGTVTLPDNTLTVGGDFNTSGSGAFVHNSGSLTLLTASNNIIKTNGSSLNNLNILGTGSTWYNGSWSSRIPITVNSSKVTASQTNFPVYVNLDDFPDSFFANVQASGNDIRVTTSDGLTEVPFELVSINTTTKIGELYFKGDVSSTTNTTFYIYHNNPSASAYAVGATYGRNNVWSNAYEGVWHMNNSGSTVIDSTGKGYTATKGGGAAAPTETTSPIGVSQSFDGGDYLDLGNVLSPGTSNWTISTWYKPTAVGISQAGILYNKENVYEGSAGGNDHQFAWMPSWVWYGGTSFSTSVGNWYYSVDVYDHVNQRMYKDGSSVFSRAQTGDIGTGTSRLQFGARGNTGHTSLFTGEIDEIRMSSVARSATWIATEYNNQSSSTAFYSSGAVEQKNVRTFTDTNATILGNYYADNASETFFPTGVLSIGGSFNNNAQFNSNNGTIKFNSTAGGETINAGNSSFATLEFNATAGDFTIIQNATATVAINLTNAQQFTLQSGKTLTTLGLFSNAAAGANTTWTGSTLRLLSGTTTTMNLKAHGGDVYGTLDAASSTLAKMWNSSANTYVTSGNTGAIYSQDHAGVDGDLNIYGNYLRTTGTEYWSYATDFDGAALVASTSRQVDVRVSTSSSVGFTNASLNMVGTSIASTTIDAISGAFSLNATNTTITAEHFRVAGTGASGFGLYASSTLSTFRDGFFTVVPGRTGITFSTSTINTNPSAQFFRIGFATTSAGVATNVTLIGTTTNFVWFREGSGNLYGEAFDGTDANPGSIRFDDSSNSIIVSGIVYSDDGITPQGAPTCNGTTPNVRIVVDGGTYTASTTCASGTGAYSFPAVNYIGDPKMVVYLNTNGGVQGSVVTKTPTTNITNMHIYANRVITRHQDVSPLTASDMQLFDNGDDSDISFVAATTSLTLLPNTELYVFASTTFAPGGNITLTGNGNANGYEGTLQLGAGATFTATGTEIHTLAGRLVLATTSTFTTASSTFIFNATTTGKSISSPNTITFNQLQFNGLGGGWNITAPITVLADMHVATGTVTGTNNISIQNGSLYGNGTLSLGSGTTTISKTNTLGGTSAWTFNNLILGNGTVVGTTTPNTSATTTILGRLTIANAHFLAAGSSKWDLAGTGTVFTETGTLLEDTSTFRFSGTSANVPSTNYYNLLLDAGAGSATYTGIGSGILVLNDLVVGGTATSTFNLNTSDPVLEVRGNVRINSNGILEASNSGLFSVLGNWTNTGAFNGNSGTVSFTTSATTDIIAGNSSFANVDINGTGSFTVSENATSTGNWTLTNHANFTLVSGKTLAVGGTFLNNIADTSTTWTGSNLFLFGTGTYEINDSSTNDSYGTLSVANNTHVRMWNSQASTYSIGSTGSLYSQDHMGVDGDLYIYGALSRTLGDDFWSYDTDFDGTDLTGGSERIAQVYFASGASGLWSGSSTLSVIGSSTASTTIQNQGSGTYGITIGSGATTEWNRVQIRNINSNGVVLAGTPTVTDFSRTDHLIDIPGGTAITVGGTVINANEAKSFTNNVFESSTTTTSNVTATGTTVSSWRFTNHTGSIAGEGFDNDPAGDPGYITWDNSAALITVSGNVYSNEGVTYSTICDDSTVNIRLVVANGTSDTNYDTTCTAATSSFSISNVAYSPLDTLVLYIIGETEKAANVTVAPISSISNMHLYENRVIVRHENTNPLTIADMAVWDSSDDANIPYTAVDSGTDTLTLPADTKLLIWANKTFEPNGNVTISGGGAGNDYDGTLEAQTNAVFRAKTTESHSIGGSVIFGTGAVFTAASSTLTLTTTGASRTFDVNANDLHNLTVTGSGSYSMTDATLNVRGSYSQSNGAVTFPTGTSTIGAAFNVTSGSFTNNGSPFVFTSTGAGNTVRFNGSTVNSLRFTGTGSWNMTDTNATSSGSVTINSGTLTLPSGNFAIGGNFTKNAGTVTHNTSDLIMTATSTATIKASSSDLFAIRFVGPATFTITDPNITFLDSFTIASGTVVMATGTTAVGGSFDVTGGTFAHSSGTVLLNASASGKVINPGASSFYNLQIGAPSGGYTLYTATTTNNFTIANVNILTANSGAVITVGGVFTNSVGGTATTWTNSNINLISGTSYSINTRSNAGDVYGTLVVGANTDIKSWYSSAATNTVAASGSLYSQDNANVNGNLYIYGDLVIATSTEYWNYAKDFDGTSLTGSERVVNVYFAQNATTTVTTGVLQILGTSGNETVLQNQATGTYALAINGGTINANYYEFNDLDIYGLQLLGLSTVTNLANGYYDLAVNTAPLITLSSTTLNANPSKIFDNLGFNATTGLSGYNIDLVGETVNAWRITNSYGNIGGEAFDHDGVDACGAIRFDDSSCLLTEQTHARWRFDDGGEGAPDSEWLDQSFTYRAQVRVLNNDNQAYASTSVKVAVPYNASMQSSFSDLRFVSSDGVTPVPFWVEKYTASTDALVWVKVPNLPASAYAHLYMYYGSSTAVSLSNGTSTFNAFDDFEDNNITEYSGDISLFNTAASPVYGGSYSLKPVSVSGKTTEGIYRTDKTISQGEIIRYMQYVNTVGTTDEPCTLFAVQSATTSKNYGVCLELFGTDRISLSKNVKNNDSSGTILASSTVSYTTGWYEVEIDWRTDNTIGIKLYNSSGSQVASISKVDSSYTAGGYGFAFWYQNGAWDSFTSRPRVATKPTVYLGAKQTFGGASWLSAQDASGSAIPDDVVRLRLSIENSGLDITGQQYRLEYAAKGVAPTCESVSSGSYTQVPNQSSCGSSPICMQTSAYVTNGAVTTDLLTGTDGTFSSGYIVTDPSSQSSAVNVNQNYYTELEYVLTPTVNATDAYCFRATNAGTPLDFYAKVAELGLQFDPVLSTVDLNGGLDISLTPGTTTAVTVTGSVSDFNGYLDITHATATVYRSGAGAACTPNNNNCYIATTENSQCSFTGCSGSTCTLSCQVDMYFHADPTATGSIPYEGEEWVAYAEVSDYSDGYDFASAMGVELLALRALDVDSLINYGALAADSDTGSFNPTTTVTNIGNVPINVDIEGTNLTDGLSSVISADLQKVSTSSFTYSGCVSCQQLATSTPVTLGINLSKPSNPTPPVDTDIYWGIAVPFSASNAAHFGTNIFTAISAD